MDKTTTCQYYETCIHTSPNKDRRIEQEHKAMYEMLIKYRSKINYFNGTCMEMGGLLSEIHTSFDKLLKDIEANHVPNSEDT